MHDELDESVCGELIRDLRASLRRDGAREGMLDDLVQDTWLRTLESPPQRMDDLRAWFRVVGRRLLWERGASERRRHECEHRGARQEHVEPDLDLGEETEILRAVRALPAKQRQVIELRYLEGLPPRAIAPRLGLTPAQVSQRLQAALLLLRSRLGEGRARKSWAIAPLAWLFSFPWRKGQPRAARLLLASSLASAALVALVGRALLRDAPPAGPAHPGALAARAEPSLPVPSAGQESRTRLPGASAAEPRAATRRVLVLDALGRPIEGATVLAAPMLTPEARAVVGRSDAQGRLELPEPAPDTLLWATHPAWADSWCAYLGSLAPGADCELLLEPGVRRRLRIEDASGVPLRDVAVALGVLKLERPTLVPGGGLSYPAERSQGRTDERGEVELLVPAEARLGYEILAGANGCARGELAALDEHAAAAAAPEVLRLPAPFGVEGVVHDAQRLPVMGARVEVFQEGRTPLATRTDAAGSFRIPGLVAGEFELCVTSGGPDPRPDSYAEAGRIRSGEWVRREIELSPAFAFQGRVWAPVPLLGARVEAMPLDVSRARRVLRTAELGTDGAFLLPACLPMPHELGVLLPDGAWLRLAQDGGGPLQPGPEEVLYRIEVAPRPVGPASVRFAEDELGRLPTFVELRTGRQGSNLVRPVDARTRTASFEALPGGNYLVFAWVPGLGAWRTERFLGRPEDPSHLELPSPRLGRLVVEVLAPAGIDASETRAQVLVHSLNASGFRQAGARSVDRDLSRTGPLRFEGELLPGRYRLLVRCPGRFGLDEEVVISAETELRRVLQPRASLEIHLDLEASPPLFVPELVTALAVTATGERVAVGEVPRIRPAEPVYVPPDTVQLELSSTHGRKGRLLFAADGPRLERGATFTLPLDWPSPEPLVRGAAFPTAERLGVEDEPPASLGRSRAAHARGE